MPPKITKEQKEVRSFLEKIIINVGVGRASQQPNFEDKALVQIMGDVAMMTGQKPQVTRAKKSIAGFKSREGQIVGVRVTLRNKKMVDFFERFIRIVLPRVHDFQGLKANMIDHGGSLNVGLKEQYVFPEINGEESTYSFPLGINFVPFKKNRDKALEEYKRLGVPFQK